MAWLSRSATTVARGETTYEPTMMTCSLAVCPWTALTMIAVASTAVKTDFFLTITINTPIYSIAYWRCDRSLVRAADFRPGNPSEPRHHRHALLPHAGCPPVPPAYRRTEPRVALVFSLSPHQRRLSVQLSSLPSLIFSPVMHPQLTAAAEPPNVGAPPRRGAERAAPHGPNRRHPLPGAASERRSDRSETTAPPFRRVRLAQRPDGCEMSATGEPSTATGAGEPASRRAVGFGCRYRFPAAPPAPRPAPPSAARGAGRAEAARAARCLLMRRPY